MNCVVYANRVCVSAFHLDEQTTIAWNKAISLHVLYLHIIAIAIQFRP